MTQAAASAMIKPMMRVGVSVGVRRLPQLRAHAALRLRTRGFEIVTQLPLGCRLLPHDGDERLARLVRSVGVEQVLEVEEERPQVGNCADGTGVEGSGGAVVRVGGWREGAHPCRSTATASAP